MLHVSFRYRHWPTVGVNLAPGVRFSQGPGLAAGGEAEARLSTAVAARCRSAAACSLVLLLLCFVSL